MAVVAVRVAVARQDEHMHEETRAAAIASTRPKVQPALIRSVRDFQLAVAKKASTALEWVSAELKDGPAVVLVVVAQDNWALQFASNRLHEAHKTGTLESLADIALDANVTAADFDLDQ